MSTGRGDVDAAARGPPGSLGCRSSAGARRPDGASALAPAPAERSDEARLRSATRAGPTTASSDRLRRARRDPRPRRPARVGQRRDPRRRLERPDDARPAARRRGPGRGLDRRLAGPVAQLRPGRGGRPRRPASSGSSSSPRPASTRACRSPAGCSPAGRSTCSSSTCPAVAWPRTDKPARIADRLHRLAALARRAETLLLILEAPGLGGGLATAVAESTGIRLELARRSWIRLGRDVVGQRTEVLVARNRAGPPGRRATLRILYAEGGERDACLARDALLIDQAPARLDQPPFTRPPIARLTTMRLLHLFLPHLLLDLARARRSEPFPTGPVVLGGQPWDPGRSSTPIRPPGRSASGAGCRSGPRTGWPLRRPSSTPSPRLTGELRGRLRGARGGSARPRRDGRSARRRRSGCSRSDRRARACGAPSRSSSSGSASALATALPGACSPRVGDRRHALRGDGRGAGRRGRTRRSSSRPAPRPRSSPSPVRPRCTTDPDIRARLHPLRAAPDRRRSPSCRGRRWSPGSARRAADSHARARGQEIEPFRPRRAPERLALGLPIEPPVEELEALRFVLRRLVVGARGAAHRPGPRRGPGAAWRLELDLAFAPTGTPPRIEVEQRFPEPTADAEAIERLLLARLERTPPPAAVARLELELRGASPAAGQQLPLFVPQAARTPGSAGSSRGSP